MFSLDRLSIRTRAAIAALCIGSLAAFVWLYAFPEASWQTMALVLGGIVVTVLLAIMVGIVGSSIGQAVLRSGGTDPDWLIFPSEPPGLVKLREQLKSSAAQSSRKA